MEFTKMQGTGNDYVYVDCFKEPVREPAKTAVYVSDRHFGIGSDGLILICPSQAADCRMEMYNADGSQGIMCGNGVRCVGKYVYDHGLVDKDKKTITVETLAGIKTLELETENGRAVSITVDMGEGVLTSRLPEDITVDGKEYRFVGINVGNPHAIYYVDEVDSLDLERIGPAFENHARFAPERVNTEFIHVVDRKHLKMRVWERGSGETWACGTGASAVTVACIMLNKAGKKGEPLNVHCKGGLLKVTHELNDHVTLEGNAVAVFDGVIDIPESVINE